MPGIVRAIEADNLKLIRFSDRGAVRILERSFFFLWLE